MSAGRAIGLLLGVAADGALGDPVRDRPVLLLTRALDRLGSPAGTRILVLRGGIVTGAALLTGIAIERASRKAGPLGQALGTGLATWAVLGGTKLAVEGTELARSLESGDLDAARRSLADLDPRHTDEADVPALSRASVEALADNTADAVVTPLVWGAVAGPAGLLAARAVDVLRDQAGHHPAHYRRSAWLVARLDDLVNRLPAHIASVLTVPAAPVVGGSARGAWRALRRDVVVHPSPNSARVEAAFAGALEVRLGGRTAYPHGVAELPVLGDGRNPDTGHVTRAIELSRVVGWLAAITSALLAGVLGLLRKRRR